MADRPVSNTFTVEVAGQPLPDKLHVERVEVESHQLLPDAFAVTFRDPERNALQDAGLKFGAKIKVTVRSDKETSPATLFEGEVTALDAEFEHGHSRSVARGYDLSFRLRRGRRTQSFLNRTPDSVVNEVRERNDIPEGKIESADSRKHIGQVNESDWDFLSRLADDIGFTLSMADGKLNFTKLPTAEAAPAANGYNSTNPLTLVPGADLHFVHASATAGEQVPEVQVRGFDVFKKEVLFATAPTETKAIANGSDSAAATSTFPKSSMLATSLMLLDPKHAERSAKALANHVAASHTEIEGEVGGNPKMRAGAAVTFDKMGAPFDGKYVVTSARHVYDAAHGYVTSFTISGEQARTTLALSSGSDAAAPAFGGVLPAVVESVEDPDHAGRVQVQLLSIAKDYVTDWCPVVQAGAGKDRGFVVLPEKGDQVLVTFVHGDLRRPIVLGGLYNQVDKPNLGPGTFFDAAAKQFNNRVFTSRVGHQLAFVDAKAGSGIHLVSGDKKLSVHLDAATHKVIISASGDLELEGANVSIKAKRGNVKVSGQQILLNS